MKMVMEASIKEEEARVEKVRQQELVEEKKMPQVAVEQSKEIAQESKKEEVKKNQFQGYNLPPVALKKGMAAFDPEILRKQHEAIN